MDDTIGFPDPGLDLSDGPEVLAWDPRAQRYVPTAELAARSV